LGADARKGEIQPRNKKKTRKENGNKGRKETKEGI
jgi:hypothetical protein